MISKVIYGDIDGKTPARFYYQSRVLMLNKREFPKFSRMAQKFIVFHEFAHADGIFNEEEADAYAFEKLINGDHSLKATVEAVAKALPFHTQEGRNRVIAQFNRAADYDYNHNRNEKANIYLTTTTTMDVPNKNNDFYAASMLAAADEYSNFLGLGKKAKEQREARQEARNEKKAAKTDLKKAKAEAIRGGTYESGASKVLNNVVDGAKTFLGIGGGSEEPAPAAPGKSATDNNDPANDTGKNKMPAWAWIAIAIVLLVIVYFLFFNKKGKK